MVKAQFTAHALRMATPEQLEAVAQKLDSPHCSGVDVTGPSFGLPESYLSIRIDYTSGSPIYGGIDPEGRVST